MAEISSQELLEAWDWYKGVSTGIPVTRCDSYMNGIAHEGVHLWIVRMPEQQPEILFQLRSPDKALYPDCLDISVGGHVPFGLKSGGIQKESMEELGISPDGSELIDLGYTRFEEITSEYHHREFQHVYIMRDDRPLDCYSFNDGEVSGIYAVPLSVIGEPVMPDFKITVQCYDGNSVIMRDITKIDFHPLLFSESMKFYMSVVLKASTEYLLDGSIHTYFPPLESLKP